MTIGNELICFNPAFIISKVNFCSCGEYVEGKAMPRTNDKNIIFSNLLKSSRSL